MKNNYPTINLLRGVATLMICIFHFTNYEDFRFQLFESEFIKGIGQIGINGVYVFFIVSGFVIPLSLYRTNFKLSEIHLFLLKRYTRIIFPYMVSIVLILLVQYVFLIKNNIAFKLETERIFYHLLFIIPFTKYDWYNAIYWTLSIEFQFYILIAFAYVFFQRKSKYISPVVLAIFIFSACFVEDKRFLFYFSLLFGLGVLLFLLMSKQFDQRTTFFFLIILFVLIYYKHGGSVLLVSLLTVFLIYYIKIDYFLSNRIGDISYSLYLTHGLIGGNIIYFSGNIFSGSLSRLSLVFIVLILSVLFSYVFWKIIECPTKNWSIQAYKSLKKNRDL